MLSPVSVGNSWTEQSCLPTTVVNDWNYDPLTELSVTIDEELLTLPIGTGMAAD